MTDTPHAYAAILEYLVIALLARQPLSSLELDQLTNEVQADILSKTEQPEVAPLLPRNEMHAALQSAMSLMRRHAQQVAA